MKWSHAKQDKIYQKHSKGQQEWIIVIKDKSAQHNTNDNKEWPETVLNQERETPDTRESNQWMY